MPALPTKHPRYGVTDTIVSIPRLQVGTRWADFARLIQNVTTDALTGVSTVTSETVEILWEATKADIVAAIDDELAAVDAAKAAVEAKKGSIPKDVAGQGGGNGPK